MGFDGLVGEGCAVVGAVADDGERRGAVQHLGAAGHGHGHLGVVAGEEGAGDFVQGPAALLILHEDAGGFDGGVHALVLVVADALHLGRLLAELLGHGGELRFRPGGQDVHAAGGVEMGQHKLREVVGCGGGAQGGAVELLHLLHDCRDAGVPSLEHGQDRDAIASARRLGCPHGRVAAGKAAGLAVDDAAIEGPAGGKLDRGVGNAPASVHEDLVDSGSSRALRDSRCAV